MEKPYVEITVLHFLILHAIIRRTALPNGFDYLELIAAIQWQCTAYHFSGHCRQQDQQLLQFINKRSTSSELKIKCIRGNVYCSFASLQSFTVTTICTPQKDPAATQKNSIKKMFTKLSSTCKRYTDVLALKNQLQCHMFHNELANNARSNVTLKITQLLIALQTAATKLQKIQIWLL